MTHLLDSSAFLAFFFNEPGCARVRSLFSDRKIRIGLSTITPIEFWARLKAEQREKSFDQEWNDHLPLFDCLLPVDLAVSLKATELRGAAKGRIPTMDSLIAATAALSGAILVHRDPHFTSIPKRLLQQESLD